MPCRDDYGDHSIEYREDPETRRKLDEVTALLCGLCGKLQNGGTFKSILSKDKNLASWWEKHQEKDRKEAERLEKKRRRKELIKKALDKLSPEEKEILGL